MRVSKLNFRNDFNKFTRLFFFERMSPLSLVRILKLKLLQYGNFVLQQVYFYVSTCIINLLCIIIFMSYILSLICIISMIIIPIDDFHEYECICCL